MKTTFIALLSLVLVCCSAPTQAQLTIDVQTVATVNWGAQNENGLGTQHGIELPQGDLIRIGTFELSDVQIQSSQHDYATLNAAFIEYDTAVIGDGLPVTAGFFAKSTSKSTDALGLSGHKIYLWAFNGSTPGGTTEQGIFTSANPAWIFPSDASIPASTTIDLGQVQPGEIVVGGFGTGTAAETGGALFNLAHVPEPSSMAVACAGFCVFIAGLRRIIGRRKEPSSPAGAFALEQ